MLPGDLRDLRKSGSDMKLDLDDRLGLRSPTDLTKHEKNLFD